MPNPIKYTAGTETQSLKKGNFFIGTGDVGKGPTSSTGFYAGVNIPSSGYTVYLNNNSLPGGLSYFTAGTDASLISQTNSLASTSFTSVTQCLTYYAGQTDKICFNIDYPPIVTSGLVLNMDAAFVPSYPTSGTSWYSVGVSGNTGSLVNGPTYSDGSIVFDGSNDGVSITPTPTITSAFTFNMWVNKTQSKDNAGIIAIQGTLWQIDNNTIYWWSNVSFGPMSHSFTSTLNQWYNFCITQDNQTAKLYINGTLVKTTTMTNVNTTRGDNTIGGWGIGDRPWLGKISLTQIYNRVLNDSEILQNYAAIGSRYFPLEVQYLVVAGGGGGNNSRSGGGGAGGLLSGSTTSLSLNTNYAVTIGSGGAYNGQGNNSKFNTVIAIGGGQSGNLHSFGFSGGSGGGSGHFWSGFGTEPILGGAGVSGQGLSGGTAFSGTSELGPGGGGASQSGGNSNSTPFGFGGAGLYSSEYVSLGGSPAGWFAGGGGGGNSYGTTRAFGGNGGGGNGSIYIGIPSTNGVVNTGGGGGGNGVWGGGSAAGGSGIVILRTPVYYSANFSSGVTFTKTIIGTYSYYVVTATSTTSETVSFS